MQRAGIIPDTFIILNLTDKKLEQSCEYMLHYIDKNSKRLNVCSTSSQRPRRKH